MCARTENPSRTLGVMLTGVSMNCSTSAKATISSNFWAISSRFIPRMAPLMKTLSRPVSSGWEAGAHF